MTEGEWLACTDPQPMLELLESTASDRKLRFFAAACCRRIWQFLDDDAGRCALETAEQCADGLLTLHESWAVGQTLNLISNVELVNRLVQATGYRWEAVNHAYFTVNLTMGWLNWRQAGSIAKGAATVVGNQALGKRADDFAYEEQEEYEQAAMPFTTVESAAQAVLLRDVFGNPFRPLAVDPAWLAWNDGTVRKMAQAIYKDRAFDRLPLLADALEDAGCTDAEILAHCRETGPHVRGCWAVDLLLGKK